MNHYKRRPPVSVSMMWWTAIRTPDRKLLIFCSLRRLLGSRRGLISVCLRRALGQSLIAAPLIVPNHEIECGRAWRRNRMRAPVVPPAALKAISHYVIDLRICNETLRVGRIVKIGLTTDYAPCWPFPRLRHSGNGGDRERPAPPPVGMRAFASSVRRCACVDLTGGKYLVAGTMHLSLWSVRRQPCDSCLRRSADQRARSDSAQSLTRLLLWHARAAQSF